jgi:hypothetical protein
MSQPSLFREGLLSFALSYFPQDQGSWMNTRYYSQFDRRYILYSYAESMSAIEQITKELNLPQPPFGVMLSDNEIWITFDEPRHSHALYMRVPFQTTVH